MATRQRARTLMRRCTTCAHSLKRGHLWLGGNDYLECPDCGGSGVITIVEERVSPATHVMIDGRKPRHTSIPVSLASPASPPTPATPAIIR